MTSVVDALAEGFRKHPWAVVVLAALVLVGAWLYSQRFVTRDDVRAMIEKHHPRVDTTVEVHGTEIETLHKQDDLLRDDIRELRSRGP